MTRLRVFSHPHRAVTAAVLAVALLGPGPAPAGATVPRPGPERCSDGDITRTRVAGDLVVSGYCSLQRLAVSGDLIIEEDGEAHLSSVTIKGDVRLAPRSQLHARWSTAWGGVRVTDAGYLSLDDSTVRGSIRGALTGVFLAEARVQGALNITFPVDNPYAGLSSVGSTVGGWVNTQGGQVGVHRSTLARGLTVSGARRVTVCDTSVTVDVTVRSARGPVEIGAGLSGSPVCWSWPPASARPTNDVAGSVWLLDNAAPVRIGNTAIAGDLTCTGNAGPQGVDAAGTTVGGTRSGQCE